MKFKREVTLLVVPFVLHMLISNSFSFIDTLMITGLGEVAVASVAAASQFSFVLGMVLSATYGMSAFITQFYGVNQMNNVYRTMGLMLTTSLLFSLFAFVLVTVFKEPLLSLFIKDEQGMAYGMQYVSVIVFVFVLNAIKDTYGHALGAIGKIKVNVIFGCIGMGFNTLFNYLLIYGVGWFPAYEVMGAAIATLLSTVISLLLVLGFVYGRRYYVNAHLKQLFSFNWSFSKRIYKTIYPLVLHEGIWSFGNMLYAVAFGHMGIVALATFQLARIFNQYFLMGISGFSYAARVMIGRKLSSDDPAEAITSARSFTRLAIYSAIVVSILIILLNPMIVNLFTELSLKCNKSLKMSSIFKVLY
ncbi:MATE family efflux transporter [Bacillus sp. JCM 19034]|uniref:MATE family efflux transporter n=1 Tax=Bacillus sp. JCM 19034 TaxID=1481928 RepID=UPI0007802DC8|nr:MATE family efflux transporter [Bacillus sp. JCM 19034]